MKISALHVTNFKRVEDISIAPDVDRALILIGGKNAQGKSSLLDAITAAFGGKAALPETAVRHGADHAEIRVELDGGALVIKRTIRGDESVLEVRDAEGKVKGPQAVLDKIVAGRFLDPLAFVALPAAAQRKALLEIVDRDGNVAKLDARRVRRFSQRTDVSRDHRKAAGELERLPEVTPAEPVDVVALRAEEAALDKRREDLRLVKAERDATRARFDAAETNVARLEKMLQDLAIQLEDAERVRDDARAPAEHALASLTRIEAEVPELVKRREACRAALDTASTRNAQIAADRERARRRAEVAAEVAKLSAEEEKLTAEIDQIDADKAAVLEAAALPVDGLEVDEHGLTLNRIPFSQASGAEQLRVALALAMAASPQLQDVWVRDGSLLDDESRAALEAAARAAGITIWMEVVGDRDPGAIVIHEGRVREDKRAAG